MDFLSLLAVIPFSFLGSQNLDYQIPEKSLQGIYLTSQTVADRAKRDSLTENFSKLGGNLIVFDIQDSNGRLAYPSTLPLSFELENRSEKIADLAATVESLHEKGFYVAARFVLFKNAFLARKKPEWTLKRKGTWNPFISKDGPIWLDPGNPELKEYLIGIAGEVALSGVDEVQFDYVRFPDSGSSSFIPYSFTNDNLYPRAKTITKFVSEAASILHFLGVKVSLDVFGIVVWDNVSWKVIGQNVSELAQSVDVIYPMPYPSHFGPGWGGHRNPADEPYFFVQETTKKFIEQTVGTDVKIRPWLQGFAYRVSKFGPNYIREQVKALHDIGVDEFSVWNARNSYEVMFAGLR